MASVDLPTKRSRSLPNVAGSPCPPVVTISLIKIPCSYLFVLQVPLHMFKVVVFWPLLTVDGSIFNSGFVTEGNLIAIGVKQDAAWHSPVPSIIELQYGGIDLAWISQVWVEKVGHRTVRCSKVNSS